MVFYCVYTVCVAASMGFTGFYRVLLAFTELNCLFFFALVYSGFTVLHRDFIQLHLLERSRIGLDRFGSGWDRVWTGFFQPFCCRLALLKKKAKRQNGIQQVVYHLHGKYLGPSHPPPP